MAQAKEVSRAGGAGPSRVLVVANSAEHMAKGYVEAFARAGVESRLFSLEAANNWVDRFVFHTLNHYGHSLRVLPKSRNWFTGHRLSHAVYRAHRLLETAREFRPELIFHLRSWNVLPPVMTELAGMSRLFGWWVEGEHRLAEVLPVLGQYHRFYFFSSGALEAARQAGHAQTAFLGHAIDSESFHPLEGVEPVYDWVFVGKWTEHRERVVRALAARGGEFAVYGPGWLRRGRLTGELARRVGGKAIWGRDLLELHARARVVVNITQWGSEGRRYGMNLRVLEVLASGACLLSDLSLDAAPLLRAGEHFAVYSDPEDAPRALEGLLADPERRRGLALEGRRAVERDFSFAGRVRTILADYQALDPGQP